MNKALEKAARAVFENYADDHQPDDYVRIARAVLLAVREPGNGAVAAGARVYAYDLAYESHAQPTEGDEALTVFTAMIDAILAEPQP